MERGDIPPSRSKHNSQGDSFFLFSPLLVPFFMLFDVHKNCKLHILDYPKLPRVIPTYFKVLQPTPNHPEIH